MTGRHISTWAEAWATVRALRGIGNEITRAMRAGTKDAAALWVDHSGRLTDDRAMELGAISLEMRWSIRDAAARRAYIYAFSDTWHRLSLPIVAHG